MILSAIQTIATAAKTADINFKNLKFTLNVRTNITLGKQQKLFLHDFVAISARWLLLFVNTSPYPNDRAVLLVLIF